MGQTEVHDLLKKLRKESNKWHTLKEIKEEMINEGYSEGYVRGVSSDLLRLTMFNFIKMRGVGVWKHHKEFQAYATLIHKNASVKKLKERN